MPDHDQAICYNERVPTNLQVYAVRNRLYRGTHNTAGERRRWRGGAATMAKTMMFEIQSFDFDFLCARGR